MAWRLPVDPSKARCTGTTGIMVTHHDGVIWAERINKEDPVHARVHNPDGFQMRNSMRAFGFPVPPHQHLPKPGEGLDFSRLGWDPEGPLAKELTGAMARAAAVPRGKFGMAETAYHQQSWGLSSPSRPARSVSMPSVGDAETGVERSRALVREAAEARARRREEKLAKCEARIDAALSRSSGFLNTGRRGVKWHKPLGETDATAFQNYFCRASGGIQLHQTRTSNEPTLRDAQNNLVRAWAP